MQKVCRLLHSHWPARQIRLLAPDLQTDQLGCVFDPVRRLEWGLSRHAPDRTDVTVQKTDEDMPERGLRPFRATHWTREFEVADDPDEDRGGPEVHEEYMPLRFRVSRDKCEARRQRDEKRVRHRLQAKRASNQKYAPRHRASA